MHGWRSEHDASTSECRAALTPQHPARPHMPAAQVVQGVFAATRPFFPSLFSFFFRLHFLLFLNNAILLRKQYRTRYLWI